METLLKEELKAHVIDKINDCFNDDDTDFEDLHNTCFNVGYYIIGYYQAEEWLKKYDVSAFEAITDCIEWELNVPEDINSESIVNLYTYIKGEELLSGIELNDITKDELIEVIKEI